MFSNEDVREIFQALPPAAGHHGMPPSLILTSSGKGLVTLDQLRADFKRRMTEETRRIPISDLAHDLDISLEPLLRLLHNDSRLSLVSNDGSEVLPKKQIDAIVERLRESLSLGVVSKDEFDSQNDISFHHLRIVLRDVEPEIKYHDDHLCTASYEKTLSEQALDIINRAISNTTNIDLRPKDLEGLPGSPPKWLFQRHLKRLTDSPEYSEEVFLHVNSESIRVQSKQMRARHVEYWRNQLLSGEVAYIDLEVMLKSNVIFDSIDDAIKDFKQLPDVDIVESFVISETWFSNLVDEKLKSLRNGEIGVVDIAEGLSERFQSTKEGHSRLPETLYTYIQRKVEQHLVTAMSRMNECDYHRFGTVVLTSNEYDSERLILLRQTKTHAATLWQQLKENSEYEVKFSVPSTTSTVAVERSIHEALTKEKAIQKACEEQFWAAIAEFEAQNETDFATFWIDRVDSRVRVYSDGLASILDQKLHDQLSELLAAYIQKELVPETISKARTQNLILSRKTKKNIAKLETTMTSNKGDFNSILSTLDKFTKKQNISSTSSSTNEFKNTMIQDMQRRMAKQQQKASDGPVLFLTLVVVLFAKHHDGVVYATGKYAPKLLKQLKGKLETEQYEQLEKWKEAAKAGTLGKEDREEMGKMAGA